MKLLLPQQPVTQKGDRPSNELVQIVQGIVSGFDDLTAQVGGLFPRGQLRARVNFNGIGVVTIRNSANVVSVSDNGPGDYTLNFFTPMPDTFFSVLITPGGTAGVIGARTADDLTPRSVSGVRILVTDAAGTPTDAAYVHVAVFR